MQDLCPLCLRNGVEKRIKLYQVTVEEAVWMCEEEKCVWPFGYEEIIFCPRVTGKIWSCYWDDYTSTSSRLKENVATCTSEESSIISSVEGKEEYEEDNNSLNNKIDTSNLQSINNNVGNIKIENECINSLHKYTKEKDGISKQNVNSTRETPKITSIKKTNINISNVKKVLSVNKFINVGETKLEPIKSNETIAKSNLSITTVEINGLPPITLSFEIPASNTTSKTVTSTIQPPKFENDNTKLNNLTPKKRSFTSGKEYEKLTVSDFLRKVKSSNSTNTNSKDSLNTKTNPRIEEEKNNSTAEAKKGNNSKNCDILNVSNLSNAHEQTIPNMSTTSVSNQHNNSTACLPSQENIVSDVAVANSIINIDTVLDDLILNGPSVSEDANDEWLEGLLNYY